MRPSALQPERPPEGCASNRESGVASAASRFNGPGRTEKSAHVHHADGLWLFVCTLKNFVRFSDVLRRYQRHGHRRDGEGDPGHRVQDRTIALQLPTSSSRCRQPSDRGGTISRHPDRRIPRNADRCHQNSGNGISDAAGDRVTLRAVRSRGMERTSDAGSTIRQRMSALVTRGCVRASRS